MIPGFYFKSLGASLSYKKKKKTFHPVPDHFFR